MDFKHYITKTGHYIKNNEIIFKFFANLFLIAVAFILIYPFLFLLITSFKSFNDIINISVNWIPRFPTFNNYIKAFTELKFFEHFMISVLLTSVSVFLHLVIDSFIAYGLARYKFRGKTVLTFFLILSILVPLQVIIIPQYIEFSTFGWNNSYLPLIVPILFGQGLKSGLFIFIFRQFFLELPKSLEEAAKIDGCGFISVFYKIFLPIARTSLLVCGVMATVWTWNDYFAPTIYLREDKFWTLPSMLPNVYKQYSDVFLSGNSYGITDLANAVTQGVVAASIFLIIIPMLIGYAFVQRKFVEGVERSGITGE